MALRDLSRRSNHYYQMNAQRDAEKRHSNPKSRNQQHPIAEHELYCDQMGILFPHGLNQPYTIRKQSYLDKRLRELRFHSYQYWFVASLTSLFFLLQVIIGAIQTALGATRSPHLLVTIFGAIATVIGGILAYLKSRGQPNRTRQLRNSLRKVVEEIEFQEISLRNPEIKTTAREAVDYVNQLYEDARFQAETNYPDFWSTAGTKAKVPGGGGNSSAGPAPQNSARTYPSSTATQPPSGQQQPPPPPPPPPQSAGNRPPSYHPPSSAQNAPSRNDAISNPPNMSLQASPSEQGTTLHAPEPSAHIPSEGGKPIQPPSRVAHTSTRGSRYMNEIV